MTLEEILKTMTKEEAQIWLQKKIEEEERKLNQLLVISRQLSTPDKYKRTSGG